MGWRMARNLAASIAVAGIGSSAALAGPERPPVCALVEKAGADALLSVPFRVVDGRIYVDARVNGGGPYSFAVDTGASGMGRADASLVAKLKLPVTGAAETSDAVASARVDTVRLASVELGGLVRRDIEVMTRDYSSRMMPEAAFAGILGRAFFADGLLVIDYPKRRLTFTRGPGLARGTAGVLGYERAFRVPVTIGAISTEGNLDTGANVSFVLPKPPFDRVGGRRKAEQHGREDRQRHAARPVPDRIRDSLRHDGAGFGQISRASGGRPCPAAFRPARRSAFLQRRALPGRGTLGRRGSAQV